MISRSQSATQLPCKRVAQQHQKMWDKVWASIITHAHHCTILQIYSMFSCNYSQRILTMVLSIILFRSAHFCLCSISPEAIKSQSFKCFDGVTIMKNAYQMWDLTGVDTFASSYLSRFTMEAGAIASLAQERKIKNVCRERTEQS